MVRHSEVYYFIRTHRDVHTQKVSALSHLRALMISFSDGAQASHGRHEVVKAAGSRLLRRRRWRRAAGRGDVASVVADALGAVPVVVARQIHHLVVEPHKLGAGGRGAAAGAQTRRGRRQAAKVVTSARCAARMRRGMCIISTAEHTPAVE